MYCSKSQCTHSLSAPAKMIETRPSHGYTDSPRPVKKTAPSHPMIHKGNEHLFASETKTLYSFFLQSSHARSVLAIPVPLKKSIRIKDTVLLSQVQLDCFGHKIHNAYGIAYYHRSTKTWESTFPKAVEVAPTILPLIGMDPDSKEKQECFENDSPTGPVELEEYSPTVIFRKNTRVSAIRPHLLGRAKF